MRKRILRSSAIIASSLASLTPHVAVKAAETSITKKLRETILDTSTQGDPAPAGTVDPPIKANDRYPWKEGIVTTTFWVGEEPTKANPTPNHTSAWDKRWAKNYGGTDNPDRAKRADYLPVAFTPKLNPFYVALPYNDVTSTGHKPEAAKVIPWFKEAYDGPGKSVLKSRWVAIRFKDRVCYAQWEDCGPYRTDHWQYVFGNERPKPNMNKGAGLDVSPAVRDYLGMADTDVTDWRFVEIHEVPSGPWTLHGENNTFVNLKTHSDMASAKRTTP